MRLYWTDFLESGNIAMMARPRGGEWLRDEIKFLKKSNISVVVSLIEKDEVIELQVEKEKEFCEYENIYFISHPIPDRGLPDSKIEFNNLLVALSELLKKDKKIAVHCRMGIGRKSMLTASLLIKNGFDKNQVFDYLTSRRTLDVPDTEDQKEYILEMFSRF